MAKQFYKFNPGATTYSETTTADTCPEGFIQIGDGTPIDFTQVYWDGSKLVDIPKQEDQSPPLPEPTAEEIRKSQYDQINFEYSNKIQNLRAACAEFVINGKDTAALTTKRTAILAEWQAKLKAVE
ncbi:MAG: hypothetical protein E6713_03035 [Sporomusaceae bacterium]|nr:hypothetical protein [Sporomusaceae bacterium]